MSILAAAEAYAKMGDFKKADKLVKMATFQANREEEDNTVGSIRISYSFEGEIKKQ